MDELQKLARNTIGQISQPPRYRSTQRKYTNCKSCQNNYEFPRKKSSLTNSITSQSLHVQYYDLYSQNRNRKYREQLGENINHNCNINHNNIHYNNITKHSSHEKISILQIKKIKQKTNPKNLTKKLKIKLISSSINKQQQNQHLSISNKKNQYKTPSRSKTNSKNKKKLTVFSAFKIRKIQSFNIQSQRNSPRKGLIVLSKDKQNQDNVHIKTIRIF